MSTAAESHYNAATVQSKGSNREKGPSIALKKFHNQVKSALIGTFARGAPRLLDLCCGRGGDLFKWSHSDVQFVKGVDISPMEVEEAKDRYAMVKYRPYPKVEFETCNHLGREVLSFGSPYDAVTIFFAIQFFTGTEKQLHTLLHTVSSNLKPGGVFMGTCPSGRSVSALLQQKHHKKGLLRMRRDWEGTARPFGCGYTF